MENKIAILLYKQDSIGPVSLLCFYTESNTPQEVGGHV